MEILTEDSRLKFNAGGKIKLEVRKVLELLGAAKGVRDI